MKTYLLIGGIVVVAGIAGFLALSPKNDAAPENQQEQVNNQQQVQNQNQDTGTSMRALLSSTKPQRCEFKDSTAAGETEGIVYIANGKMRGDFKMVAANGAYSDGNMIMFDNTIYSWSSAYPTMGIKMSFDNSASAQQNSPMDPDKKVDYECKDWVADDGMFGLPAGITFQDMSSFMINGPTN